MTKSEYLEEGQTYRSVVGCSEDASVETVVKAYQNTIDSKANDPETKAYLQAIYAEFKETKEYAPYHASKLEQMRNGGAVHAPSQAQRRVTEASATSLNFSPCRIL